MGKLPQPHVDDDGQLVLQGELFWKWKALHEAVQRCDAEIKLRTPLIDAMLEQQPELKKLLGERTAYIQQSMSVRTDYKAVVAELETHFGFSMAEASIDDQTGRVHKLGAAPTPPIKNGVHKSSQVRTTKPPPVAAQAPTKKPKTRK